jgi:hypothetical protein
VVNGQYSPNPFDITATVFNNGSATATGVALALNLPGDLNLVAGQPTQSIGDLAPGQERQLFWSVEPAPANPNVETTLTYGVTATATNANPKTVTRQITIPPLGPPTSDCSTSAGSWANRSIAAQTGTFTAAFDATPNNAPMDGVMGFSAQPAAAYADLAAIVRFSPLGAIDARNGGAYQAASQIAYTAGTRYHFRMIVNVPSHTYDAYVTAPGGAEQTIGLGYAFRTEQSGASQLGNLGLYAKSGSHQVCGLSVTASSPTTSSLSGRVTTSNNSPLADVAIADGAGHSATTDSNGNYQINGLSAGSYTLRPTKGGYTFAPATRAVSVPPAQSGLDFVGTPTSGGNCMSSAGSWANRSIAAQTGTFTAAFDATPNNAPMDGVMGFSAQPATAYADLAAIVRFSPLGAIDARNGGAYQAASQIGYTAGTSYHFRLVIRIPSHTYDAYVTAPGGAEQTIGLNYAFRTEQSAVGTLGNLGLYAKSGSHEVCNVTVSAVQDTTPPAAIRDLVTGPGGHPGEVILIWTAPGNNGTAGGPATRYELRYSTNPINTVADWNNAVNLPMSKQPAAPGTHEQQLLPTSFTTGIRRYFAIRAADLAGNLAGLSNVPSLRDTAFRPDPYGYQFQNYAGQPSDFDIDDLRKMVGDRADVRLLSGLAPSLMEARLSYRRVGWRAVSGNGDKQPAPVHRARSTIRSPERKIYHIRSGTKPRCPTLRVVLST